MAIYIKNTKNRINSLCERLSGVINGSGEMDCVLEAVGELAYLSHCYRAAMAENAKLKADAEHQAKGE